MQKSQCMADLMRYDKLFLPATGPLDVHDLGQYHGSFLQCNVLALCTNRGMRTLLVIEAYPNISARLAFINMEVHYAFELFQLKAELPSLMGTSVDKRKRYTLQKVK